MLFVYVDNSNIWIEGMRVSAVNEGLVSSVEESIDLDIKDVSWKYDFGKLYALACPANEQIGRSILYGSRPPENDSLWDMAREAEFEVNVFDRNASNREKKVDTGLTTVMVTDAYEHMKPRLPDVTAVLVGGDGDFVPPVEAIKALGIKVRVVAWRHSTSHELIASADDFIDLAEHFEQITL